jgi:hypothetical protein
MPPAVGGGTGAVLKNDAINADGAVVVVGRLKERRAVRKVRAPVGAEVGLFMLAIASCVRPSSAGRTSWQPWPRVFFLT